MRTLYLGIIAFVIWSIVARWHYVCKIKQHCSVSTIEKLAVIPLRSLDLDFIDEGNPILQHYEQFYFPKNSPSAVLSENNNDFLLKLKNFFDKNPDKSLKVIGFYEDNEEQLNTAKFENLGLARADDIREELIKKEMEAAQIIIDYGTSLNATNKPIRFTTTAEKESRFTFTNMTFSGANFESGSAIFEPSPQFSLYADSLKTYTQLHQNSIITIIGHTDNEGNELYNIELSRQRAMAVNQYFIKKGIVADIQIVSKGEGEPTADNISEGGRQKNRRVQIRIN